MIDAGAPTASSGGQPRYNEIFEQLVQKDDDLVGMIAYALYKQHKREWLLKFEARERRRPTPPEVLLFVEAQTQSQLLRLRQTAEFVLSEYSETIVEIEKPSIQRAALETELANATKGTLSKIEGNSRWYKQIGTGIASAAAWSIILLVLLLVLAVFGVDVLSASEKIHPVFEHSPASHQP